MCCPVYRILNTADRMPFRRHSGEMPNDQFAESKLNYSPLPGPVPKPVSLELQIVLLFFSDIEI